MARLDEHTLTLDQLRKTYPTGIEAVRGMSLIVRPGEVFGLVGPNGAGKTTLLKLASGLLYPQAGRVLCGAEDLTGQPRRAARCIGFMPDPLGVYTDVSAREYLEFFARTLEIPASERAGRMDEVVELLGLAPWLEEEVETLSAGWQRRLALGRVLLGRAPILLLDEPAAGLDVAARSELLKLVKQLAAGHRAIVISSHILPELHQLADRFGIVNRGQWVEVAPGQVFFSRADIQSGFGRARWLLRGSRPEVIRQILAGRGLAVDAAAGDGVTFAAAGEAMAAAALRAVMDQGVDVFEFRLQQMELTDLVLRTLREEPPPL